MALTSRRGFLKKAGLGTAVAATLPTPALSTAIRGAADDGIATNIADALAHPRTEAPWWGLCSVMRSRSRSARPQME